MSKSREPKMTREQRRAAATRAAKRALADVKPVLVVDAAIAKAKRKSRS